MKLEANMTTVHDARPTPLAIELRSSTHRTSVPDLSMRFRDSLGAAAEAVIDGASVLGQFATSNVSALVRGATGALTADGPSTGGNGADPLGDSERLLASSADMNLTLLRLQEEISAENRRFSALSNVLKAQHETAKAAIQNIR